MRPRLSGLSVSEGSSLCIPSHAAPAKAGAFAYSGARQTAKAGAFAYVAGGFCCLSLHR